MVTDSGAIRRKLTYPTCILCSGIPQRMEGSQHDTADERFFMSDKNMANFGPVTAEFCRRVCAGRVTRGALPRI